MKMEKKIWKMNFQKLNAQSKVWKLHNINELCWVFYCVNDRKDIE